MRLIDADKFLKETLTAGIGKTIIEYSESNIGYMIRRQLTVDAADVLRNQWISVKERLPYENENCLFISSANNSVYIGRYIFTGKKGAVKFEKRDGRGTCCIQRLTGCPCRSRRRFRRRTNHETLRC